MRLILHGYTYMHCIVLCIVLHCIVIFSGHLQVVRDVPPFEYDDYEDVTRILHDLAATHPDIAYVFSIGVTYQGRQQWMIRITSDVDHDIPNNKPAAIFSCAIHGRERIPVQVGLSFANYLCAHKSDPDIQDLIENLDIYIMPMMNPDGTMFNGCCQSANCWRKNTELHHDRGFESMVAANGAGTDLNRTFDYEWDYVGSGKILQVISYRGIQPLLSSDAASLRKFMKSRPTLAINIDWHSAVGAVYYLWNGTYDSVSNACHRNVLMSIAAGIANITGYVFQEGNRLYLSSGGTEDSTEALLGVLDFTIETQWNVNGLKPIYTCELFDPPYPTDQTLLDIQNNIKAGLYVLKVIKDGPYKSF